MLGALNFIGRRMGAVRQKGDSQSTGNLDGTTQNSLELQNPTTASKFSATPRLLKQENFERTLPDIPKKAIRKRIPSQDGFHISQIPSTPNHSELNSGDRGSGRGAESTAQTVPTPTGSLNAPLRLFETKSFEPSASNRGLQTPPPLILLDTGGCNASRTLLESGRSRTRSMEAYEPLHFMSTPLQNKAAAHDYIKKTLETSFSNQVGPTPLTPGDVTQAKYCSDASLQNADTPIADTASSQCLLPWADSGGPPNAPPACSSNKGSKCCSGVPMPLTAPQCAEPFYPEIGCGTPISAVYYPTVAPSVAVFQSERPTEVGNTDKREQVRTSPTTSASECSNPFHETLSSAYRSCTTLSTYAPFGNPGSLAAPPPVRSRRACFTTPTVPCLDVSGLHTFQQKSSSPELEACTTGTEKEGADAVAAEIPVSRTGRALRNGRGGMRAAVRRRNGFGRSANLPSGSSLRPITKPKVGNSTPKFVRMLRLYFSKRAKPDTLPSPISSVRCSNFVRGNFKNNATSSDSADFRPCFAVQEKFGENSSIASVNHHLLNGEKRLAEHSRDFFRSAQWRNSRSNDSAVTSASCTQDTRPIAGTLVGPSVHCVGFGLAAYGRKKRCSEEYQPVRRSHAPDPLENTHVSALQIPFLQNCYTGGGGGGTGMAIYGGKTAPASLLHNMGIASCKPLQKNGATRLTELHSVSGASFEHELGRNGLQTETRTTISRSAAEDAYDKVFLHKLKNHIAREYTTNAWNREKENFTHYLTNDCSKSTLDVTESMNGTDIVGREKGSGGCGIETTKAVQFFVKNIERDAHSRWHNRQIMQRLLARRWIYREDLFRVVRRFTNANCCCTHSYYMLKNILEPNAPQCAAHADKDLLSVSACGGCNKLDCIKNGEEGKWDKSLATAGTYKLDSCRRCADSREETEAVVEKLLEFWLRSQRRQNSVSDYEIIKVLGRGGFGTVYLSRRKTDGHLFALKKIDKRKYLKEKAVERLYTERQLHKSLCVGRINKIFVPDSEDEMSFQTTNISLSNSMISTSANVFNQRAEYCNDGIGEGRTESVSTGVLPEPDDGSENIVRLHKIFQSRRYIFQVYELLTGGTLMRFLHAKTMFTERETKLLIYKLILGVERLHERGFVHRDIKPDNLVFDEFGNIKLLDFGLVRYAPSSFLYQRPAQLLPAVGAGQTMSTRGSERQQRAAIQRCKNAIELKPPSICEDGEIVSNSGKFRVRFLRTEKILNRECESQATLHQPACLASGPERSYKSCSDSTSRHNVLELNSQFTPLASICGTPIYTAPEVLQGTPYSSTIDLWAIGLLMFEMLYGGIPFCPPAPHQLRNRGHPRSERERLRLQKEISDIVKSKVVNFKTICPVPYPGAVSERLSCEAISMMQGLICEASERVTDIHVLKRHPWFADVQNVAAEVANKASEAETGLRLKRLSTLPRPRIDDYSISITGSVPLGQQSFLSGTRDCRTEKEVPSSLREMSNRRESQLLQQICDRDCESLVKQEKIKHAGPFYAECQDYAARHYGHHVAPVDSKDLSSFCNHTLEERAAEREERALLLFFQKERDNKNQNRLVTVRSAADDEEIAPEPSDMDTALSSETNFQNYDFDCCASVAQQVLEILIAELSSFEK